MGNSAKAVVQAMFGAFRNGDVEGILETVSDDSLWIYHGTQVIPAGEFRGREGTRRFFAGILEKTEMIEFRDERYIVEGNSVVVLGREHQKVKRSGRELKQKWVQVYTVENGLIVRMEEFASSEVVQP